MPANKFFFNFIPSYYYQSIKWNKYVMDKDTKISRKNTKDDDLQSFGKASSRENSSELDCNDTKEIKKEGFQGEKNESLSKVYTLNNNYHDMIDDINYR